MARKQIEAVCLERQPHRDGIKRLQLVQRGVNSRHIYAARALPFVVHLKGFAIVLL